MRRRTHCLRLAFDHGDFHFDMAAKVVTRDGIRKVWRRDTLTERLSVDVRHVNARNHAKRQQFITVRMIQLGGQNKTDAHMDSKGHT